MNKRETLRYIANNDVKAFNQILENFRKKAEYVEVGDEHLSGYDEVFSAGEGKHWGGFGTRFVAIKRSYESEWTDKIDVEFYNKERA